MKIERHLRSVISYYFCEKYGEHQSFYLDENNFSIYPKYSTDVKRLVGELDKLANQNSDYAYINHHRNTYNNVPLWVLFNGITFGTLSKFYALMTQDLQFKASLTNTIDHYIQNTTALSKNDILSAMGFPTNWINI